MKITIKNLQQQTFCINFQETQTVAELKKAIFEDRGEDYLVHRQKLIYAGVILEDERTLASYNIDEKKFLVVMLKREIGSTSNAISNVEPNGKAKSTTSSITNDQGEVKKATDAPKEVLKSDSKNEIKSQPKTSAAESKLLMGEEYIRTVESMIEMGYTREMVERAMAASYNNPERAVEYLISGIPQSSETGILPPTNVNALSEASNADTPIGDDGQNESNNANIEGDQIRQDPFEFLRNQPQFLQMRSLVYQNPDLLQAVLRQIGQTNPALLQLISENQDAFLNMLNQPFNENRSTEGNDVQQTARRTQLEAATRALTNDNLSIGRLQEPRSETDVNQSNTTPQGTSMTLRLTPRDQEAIERLKALGFSEAMVIQAYFACEKDEQLAANLLISSSFDD